MKESSPVNVGVFKRPTSVAIFGEKGWDDSLKGVFPGVTIGVALDREEIWSRSVHTHHVGIFGLTSKDRLYGVKIARAKRQAQRIADKLK